MSLTPATAGGASFRTVEIQDRTVSSVTTDESGRLVSIVSNRGIELCHCNTLFSSGGATKDLQFIPVITVKGTGTANASLVTSMCVEWNPSRKMKEYFATTAPNSRVLLWKVGAQIQQSPTVVGQISAARIPSKTTIASLSWSLPEPSIFVTCAGRNSDVTVWNFEALSSQKGVVMRKPSTTTSLVTQQLLCATTFIIFSLSLF